MSASAIFAAAQQLSRDPRVRKIARSGARYGVRQLRRSRVRRAGRGRWYAGRKIGIPPSFGSRITSRTQSTQPVRRIASSTGTGSDSVVQDTELTSIPVSSDGTHDGYSFNSYVIPTSATFFPKLAVKSATYSEYDIRSLTFEYRPSIGTVKDGQIVMGWSPQPFEKDAAAQYATPTSIEALTVHAIGSITAPLRMTIPAKDFSKRGLGLLLRAHANSYDGSLYYCGHFGFRVFDNSDTLDSIGTIHVTYNVCLKKPVLSTSTKASVMVAAGSGRFTIEENGQFAPLVTAAAGFRFFTAETVLLVLSQASDMPELSKAGVVQSADRTFAASEGHAMNYAFYTVEFATVRTLWTTMADRVVILPCPSVDWL